MDYIDPALGWPLALVLWTALTYLTARNLRNRK